MNFVEMIEGQDDKDRAQRMVLIEIYCTRCTALLRFRWPERENALVRSPPQIAAFSHQHTHATTVEIDRPLVQEAA